MTCSDRLKGSLDSISKSSDSSANSHDINSRRLPGKVGRSVQQISSARPPALLGYDGGVNRSVDNLDRGYLQPPSMGNAHKARSVSSERTFAAPESSHSNDVAPAQYRCTRATEELKRKFFENGLMPQGGPVYGSRSTSGSSLMTSAFHKSAHRQPQVSHNHPHSSRAHAHRSAGGERPDSQRTQHTASENAAPQSYGLTVSLASVKTGSSAQNTDAAPAHLLATPTRSYQQQRLSFQEQQPVSLVSTRRRCFESDSNLHLQPSSTHSSPSKPPFASPAHLSSQSNIAKYSSSHEIMLGSGRPVLQSSDPASSKLSPRRVPEVPPAQLPMYQRSNPAAGLSHVDGEHRLRSRSRSTERQDNSKAGEFMASYFAVSISR